MANNLPKVTDEVSQIDPLTKYRGLVILFYALNAATIGVFIYGTYRLCVGRYFMRHERDFEDGPFVTSDIVGLKYVAHIILVGCICLSLALAAQGVGKLALDIARGI